MLSNKRSSYPEQRTKDVKDPRLENLMDLLSSKITERFTKLADAFKFFDSSKDGSLNF